MNIVRFQDPQGMLNRMARQIASHKGWDLQGQEHSNGNEADPASTLLVFGNEADRDACIEQLDQFTVSFTADWTLD